MGMFIPIKDGKLNCIVEGNGEPVLFIHGFPLDLRIWQPQVEAFVQAGYQVIRYDLRGFGNSSVPQLKKSYSHSDDLAKLVREMKFDEVNIVASSFGGEVAIDFTLDWGSKVKSLTLLSTNISGMDGDPESPIEQWIEKARKGEFAQVKQEMLNHESTKGLEGQGRQLLERVIQDYSMWHFLNDDPRVVYHNNNRLGEIVAPVLIMVGGNESEWVKRSSGYAEKNIIKSSSHVLDGLGHFMNLESPEEVNDRIIHFLRDENS